MNSGQEALAKGDTDKAIEILNKSVEMYPEYTDEHNAYEPLADAYLKKGDKKAAIDTLKKFMTYSETGFKARRETGRIFSRRQATSRERATPGRRHVHPSDGYGRASEARRSFIEVKSSTLRPLVSSKHCLR